MMQSSDLSIVKERVMSMAQANKGQLSLCYGLRSHSKVVSYSLWTFSQTISQAGDLNKFFINSITGGIS
ncbi:hypothetical protein WH8501_13950 [Crocosphaera watsonii WH 8501]|nr:MULTISPECIES: hypothetical protein [Crocosphaera]MCH2245888.1 hypothetical protein [Crocosphaera sp.]NQZ60997.1 hypothetical protein [Crocosphaera sp.]